MTAYYNENDPFAAEWLRRLIKEGLIADGEVDSRSIVDVRPADLVGYQQCHFFAGIGGWSYALRLAEWPDDRPVWTGSCPCQPFSLAGKRKGFADDRHLWPTWSDLIRECRPPVILGEQVASAADWLRLVRGDLEEMGFAVGAIPIEAASAGADHLRDRYWFVGNDTRERRGEGRPQHEVRRGRAAVAKPGILEHSARLSEREPDHQGDSITDGRQARSVFGSPSDYGVGLADADSKRLEGIRANNTATRREDERRSPGLCDGTDLCWVTGADGKARRVKSGVRLLAHGVPNRVGLLRGFGNAIDPRPAAAFIRAAMT